MSNKSFVISEKLIIEVINYINSQPVMPPATLLLPQTLLNQISTLPEDTATKELADMKQSLLEAKENKKTPKK